MKGGNSKSGARKIDRKLSVTRPKLPVMNLSVTRPKRPRMKIAYPFDPPEFFLQNYYQKKYLSQNPLRTTNYFRKLANSGRQVWETMSEEERAPYVKGSAEQWEIYNKYMAEDFKIALEEYEERVSAYIKCREEAAAAQGKTYSYLTDDPCSESESENEIEIESEEADSCRRSRI